MLPLAVFVLMVVYTLGGTIGSPHYTTPYYTTRYSSSSYYTDAPKYYPTQAPEYYTTTTPAPVYYEAPNYYFA